MLILHTIIFCSIRILEPCTNPDEQSLANVIKLEAVKDPITYLKLPIYGAHNLNFSFLNEMSC